MQSQRGEHAYIKKLIVVLKTKLVLSKRAKKILLKSPHAVVEHRFDENLACQKSVVNQHRAVALEKNGRHASAQRGVSFQNLALV